MSDTPTFKAGDRVRLKQIVKPILEMGPTTFHRHGTSPAMMSAMVEQTIHVVREIASNGVVEVIIQSYPWSLMPDEIEAIAETPQTARIIESAIPDSGTHTSFTTGAVRDANEGKGLPHMIPPIALRLMAQRFEEGAKKYARNNWMKGIPLSRYQDAVYRHMMAWSEGNTDESHMGALIWNVCCMAWTEQSIKDGVLPAELNDLPYHPGSK